MSKPNYLFKAILFVLLILIYYLVCIANPNKDFDIFIGAAKLISEKKTCYNVWIHSGKEGLMYFYSPLFALLLQPLSYLPQVAYTSFWFVLNIFFLWRIFILLTVYCPFNSTHKNKTQLFLVLCLASLGRFLFDNLQLGQMTIFLVYGSLQALHLIRTKRVYFGAALLALIINIKIIPLAILALLFYKAEYKAAFMTLLFCCLYLLLPIPFIGYDFNQTLLVDWWQSLLGTNKHSIIDDYGRQSLSSFIPALLMDTPIQFGIKRNFFQLNEFTVNLILNGVRLVCLLLIAILLGKPFQKFKTNNELFFAFALVCLFTPLIFPHQGKYSFYYLLPAFAYVLWTQLTNNFKAKSLNQKISLILLISSFALLTLSTDGLIGRHLSDLCEYFNFITLGAFALLGALVLERKNAEKTSSTSFSIPT